jgi:alkanesulfonate monooxygenase SsuD/methylene tetrahydromethanopterin reductase-like flavin-dependent oxidoreductase (luciferase family)
MVTHGIKGVVGGGAASTLLSGNVVQSWQEALARHGQQTELGGQLVIGMTCLIDDTEEKAYGRAAPLLEEYQKMFAPLGFVRPITPEQVEMVANPATARQAGLQNPREQGWILGPPERMIERLLELEQQFPGLEEVMIGQPVGTPRAILLEQLEIVGTQVIPAFRARQAQKAAPSLGG